MNSKYLQQLEQASQIYNERVLLINAVLNWLQHTAADNYFEFDENSHFLEKMIDDLERQKAGINAMLNIVNICLKEAK